MCAALGHPRMEFLFFLFFLLSALLCSALLGSDPECAFIDGVKQRDEYGFEPIAVYSHLKYVGLARGEVKALCAEMFTVYVLCNGFFGTQNYENNNWLQQNIRINDDDQQMHSSSLSFIL